MVEFNSSEQNTIKRCFLDFKNVLKRFLCVLKRFLHVLIWTRKWTHEKRAMDTDIEFEFLDQTQCLKPKNFRVPKRIFQLITLIFDNVEGGILKGKRHKKKFSAGENLFSDKLIDD
ncbi:hypothetical protein BpHYR1_006907 [Brachionus plicatilis]|uniref:Uncharacterized protein n=1 Tax=Brachionus plicatilis TaxID=10195 RepID=A0A3M7QSW6_BRAPC|nr:hypothetical protein BpHYR1_006907 [Brachionus plicatilis]